MHELEELKPQVTTICLLDFTLPQLQTILANENIAKALANHKESSPLEHIDEFINLLESPTVSYHLNEKSILETRGEWTVEIPIEIAVQMQTI